MKLNDIMYKQLNVPFIYFHESFQFWSKRMWYLQSYQNKTVVEDVMYYYPSSAHPLTDVIKLICCSGIEPGVLLIIIGHGKPLFIIAIRQIFTLKSSFVCTIIDKICSHIICNTCSWKNSDYLQKTTKIYSSLLWHGFLPFGLIYYNIGPLHCCQSLLYDV